MFKLIVILLAIKYSNFENCTVVQAPHVNFSVSVLYGATMSRPVRCNERHINPTLPLGKLFILALIAGDINPNPGPDSISVYPCGHCENAVTWEHPRAICLVITAVFGTTMSFMAALQWTSQDFKTLMFRGSV